MRRACAAGVRVGAANELFSAMPASFATACTGHSMIQEPAFFEYVKSLVQHSMPGVVVLGGWPSFLWGQNGNGPVPADLDAVRDVVLPDSADFEAIIDEVFRLDSASPPMLQRGGALRPAVRAFLVMYYPEREAVPRRDGTRKSRHRSAQRRHPLWARELRRRRP